MKYSITNTIMVLIVICIVSISLITPIVLAQSDGIETDFEPDRLIAGENHYFLVNETSNEVFAYDIDDGSFVWNYTSEIPIGDIRNIIYNQENEENYLYISSQTGANPGLEKIDISDGTQVWNSSPTGSNARVTLTNTQANFIYAADDDIESFWRVNRVDGSNEWEVQPTQNPDGLTQEPNGRVLTGMENDIGGSNVYSTGVDLNGWIYLGVWNNNDGSNIDIRYFGNEDMGATRLDMKGVTGDTVVGIRQGESIEAYNIGDLTTKWTIPTDTSTMGVITEPDGTNNPNIYATVDNFIVKYDIDGNELWNVSSFNDANTVGDPDLTDEAVVYSTTENNIIKLNPLTGEEIEVLEFASGFTFLYDVFGNNIVVYSGETGSIFIEGITTDSLPDDPTNNIDNILLQSFPERVVTVVFDRTIIAIAISTFLGSAAVDKVRNPWVGLGTSFGILMLAWLMGFVPLGVMFGAIFFVIIAGFMMMNVERSTVIYQ